MSSALINSYKSSSGLSVRAANVDLTGANSLFGTIGRKSFFPSTSMSFIPDGENGETIDLTGDSLDVKGKWLGLDNKQMQFWAYNYCSPLAAVIDRLAEADTNGRIEFRNEDGTVVSNPNKIPRLARIKKLFKKPNPSQTWEEFNSQQIVLAKIFGYCPVFCICPFGMDKSYTTFMFNLNPFFLTPRPNENYSLFGDNGDGIERTNPIKEWYFTISGQEYTIPARDIMLVKDGFIEQTNPQLGLPLSKIAGLDFNVSNICAAMEADNVLLKKKGPLGVFSHEYKPDQAGLQPMTQSGKDDLQNQLRNYGLTLTQLQYVISKWPIKWNPMSFNAEELKTKETVRQGTDGICDRLGYPAELMSGKNATYENRSSAEKFLYQNNIIPFSLRRMARYNEFFSLDYIHLYMDYNHLPVLQEDILHAGQASKAESEGLDIEWKAGMINWNQWQVAKERDAVVGMDIYYPEWFEKYGKKLPENVKAKPTSKNPTAA